MKATAYPTVTELDKFAYELAAGAVHALAHVRDLPAVNRDDLADALCRLLRDRLHIVVPAATVRGALPALIEDAQTEAVTA